MALLGSLVVKIAAESGVFEDVMDRASRKAAQQADRINRSLKSIGIGAVALGGGIALAVKSALDNADRFDELSQKTGVGVSDLTRYTLALKTSGLDSESFANSLGKLNRAIFDGNDAFKALGVATVDAAGQQRATNDVFLDVADRFSQFQDGAAKSALAQQLFGKSGADLIPVLNMGKKGLQENAEAAQRLGLVLSDDVAKQAAQVSDQLDAVSAAAAGSANQLLAGLLPSLVSTAQAFQTSADKSSAFETAGKALGVMLKGLVSAGVGVSAVFQATGDVIGNVAAAAASAATGDFAQAKAILADNSGLEEIMQRSADRINAIWTDAAAKAESNAPTQSSQIAAPVVQAKTKIKGSLDDIEKMLDSRYDTLADLAKQVAELQTSPEAVERDEFEASGGDIAKYDELIKKRDELTKRKDIGLRMDGFIKDIEGTDAAFEEMMKNQEAINRLFAEGKIDAGQYADLISGLDDSFQSFSEVAAKEAGNALSVFAERALGNIQDITASLFKGTLSGKQFGKAIVGSLRDIAAELAAKAALEALFSSIGSFAGSYFGGTNASSAVPKRAAGGPVRSNNVYQVAENGPEMLTANGKSYLLTGGSNGAVIPNPALRSYGGKSSGAAAPQPMRVEINVDARGADGADAILRAADSIKSDVMRSMSEQFRRRTGAFA